MYLVELDKLTGLVKIEKGHDGIMAVKEFRDLVHDKTLGVEALTCVALHIDWQSPIRFWIERDRPIKAQKMVYKKRDAIVWKQEKIQAALNAYSELQYHPDLVEKASLDEMLRVQMKDIKAAKTNEQKTPLFKQLRDIKDLLKIWHADNKDLDLTAGGPVVNGYKLARLEEKRLDKDSFYNTN